MTTRAALSVLVALLAACPPVAGAAAPCPTMPGRTVPVEVRFAADKDALVAGVTVLVRYPDAKVDVPGSGRQLARGTVDGTPAGALVAAEDRDGAIRVAVGSAQPMPHGSLFTLHVATCDGAPAPAAEDFACEVQEAVDIVPNPITGVTCSVVVKWRAGASRAPPGANDGRGAAARSGGGIRPGTDRRAPRTIRPASCSRRRSCPRRPHRHPVPRRGSPAAATTSTRRRPAPRTRHPS
jgi:hypothetical protein